mmetsp:Transcript_34980/g.58605  ORF Transcript_34980/g.58605 Transcript_34980/m.58605 type:complete len:209 (+) Transcript_34980:973-1599(+)
MPRTCPCRSKTFHPQPWSRRSQLLPSFWPLQCCKTQRRYRSKAHGPQNQFCRVRRHPSILAPHPPTQSQCCRSLRSRTNLPCGLWHQRSPSLVPKLPPLHGTPATIYQNRPATHSSTNMHTSNPSGRTISTAHNREPSPITRERHYSGGVTRPPNGCHRPRIPHRLSCGASLATRKEKCSGPAASSKTSNNCFRPHVPASGAASMQHS